MQTYYPTYPDLKDKVILVTGAMRGIGKEIAIALAKQNAHVVFNYRQNEEDAKYFANELSSFGGKATPIYFDVTNQEQIETSIKDFTKDFGLISGLVNNAGSSKDQLILRLKDQDVLETLNVNLVGSIRVASALSRSFLKAQDVSVVNIGSVVGLMGNAGQIAYASSKAGLIGFTKSFSKELASKNVRCNIICPGFIETDMTDELDEKIKTQYLEGIPLKRFGHVQEVANLTLFLLSKASSYITGEVLKIDGGLYI